MHFLRTAIWKILKILLLVCIISGLCIYFLFFTSAGLNTLLSIGRQIVPGKLVIGKVEGKLNKNFFLYNVHYRYQNIKIDIDSMSVSWDLSQLFQYQINIINLVIDGVKIYLPMRQVNPGEDKSLFINKSLRNIVAGSRFISLQHLKMSNLSVIREKACLVQINKLVLSHLGIDETLLYIHSSAGDIKGKIILHRSPSISWNAQFKVLHLDPSAFNPQWKGDIHLTLSTNGVWLRNRHQMHLKVLGLRGLLHGLPLHGITQLDYDEGTLIIHDTKLSWGDSSIKLSGTLNKTWKLGWQMMIPHLHTLLPSAEGNINGAGTISGLSTMPEIQANIHATHLVINEIEIAHFHGNTHIHFNDMKDLIPLIGINNFPDSTTNTKKLSAAINNFLARSHIRISNTSFYLPAIGVNIHNLSLYGTGSLMHFMRIQGQFMSGEGQAIFNGSFDMSNQSFPINIKLSGNNLQLINLKEYKIKISPQFDISYIRKLLSIKGKIHIPYADISVNNFNNVVTLPAEVIIVNQKQAHFNLPATLMLKIQVTLGDQINVAYKNVYAKIAGKLVILQQPGTSATGIGELHAVSGHYQAYDKLLDIKHGRLIYSGNMITNPGLDIRATKKIKTVGLNNPSTQFNSSTQLQNVYTGYDYVTVGIAVKGTLDNPLISLVSEPAMNQEDILSYLIFGYPRSQITASSSLLLLNTMAANLNSNNKLSLRGITGGLQNKLGLSELGVGTTNYYYTSNNNSPSSSSITTFNIGKQLGEHISIKYSLGLFAPISILNIRYQINRYLTIQSEMSSFDSGADLLYEFEQ
jgi:autotransporter translocation and assembly factor TamB